MTEPFDLQRYLNEGIEDIIKSIVKATLANPRESFFLAKYVKAAQKATGKRQKAEARGEHVPPFLIASITGHCNLRCSGCYARVNQGCGGEDDEDLLTSSQWRDLFDEAEDLGVAFILLAGGEPLLRRDVLTAAGTLPNLLFPIFTNGTLLNDEYLKLFDGCRNLIPMLSLEGDESLTDRRRGNGVYRRLLTAMAQLKAKGILYGVSITVTRENLNTVTSAGFLADLAQKGVRGVIYVEYVPFDNEDANLVLDDTTRQRFDEALGQLRENYREMILIAFPGDEQASGGCLAAGRGFFHINAKGGAEPCPFAPYSDFNVKAGGLKAALQSDLFRKLREDGVLMAEHEGGCTLFDRKDLVAALLK